MAGQTMPNVGQAVTAALVNLGDLIPALKAESVCLQASLNAGVVDAYLDVFVNDAVPANAAFVTWQEPVRYRVPGGSPLILLNFILTAGQQLQVRASTAAIISVVLFNRWRFDA